VLYLFDWSLQLAVIALENGVSFFDRLRLFFTRACGGCVYTLKEIKGRFDSYYNKIWTKIYHPEWVDKQLLDMLFYLTKSSIKPPETDEKWVVWIEAWFTKHKDGYEDWLVEFKRSETLREDRERQRAKRDADMLNERHERAWERDNTEYHRLLKENNAASLTELVALFKKGKLKT